MSTTAPAFAFPDIDGSVQEDPDEDQARFLRDNGLLVIRGLVRGDELARLRHETLALVERARAGWDDPDVGYGADTPSGERVPNRVEYIASRSAAARALLAHPFILRAVERLQGPGFIPTWDAMVFKNPGAGTGVGWHRDAATDCLETAGGEDWLNPVFNVDVYLDRADRSNCVWGIPGSNRWSAERAAAVCDELNAGGFHVGHGAVPIEVEAGDVIIHTVTTLHASAPTTGPLRRVLYYEFRPCALEFARGPHIPDYIPAKQRVLQACMRERAAAPYASAERAFTYAPEPRFAPPPLRDDEAVDCRCPHGRYWRR